MNIKIQKIITTIVVFAFVTGCFAAMPIANAAPHQQHGHTHSPYRIGTVAPTCTLEGYTFKELKATGERWYSDYVPPLGHTWGQAVLDGEDWLAVCTVCGWQGYVKDDCIIITVAPTCTAAGYTIEQYKNGWIGNQQFTAPALGHLYEEAVWDGFGYWFACERCGWAGYLLLEGVTASAFVTQLSGNTNELTITVTQIYSDEYTKDVTETFSIRNNSDGTFAVDSYNVYVSTQGNTQIRACYIV